MSIDRDERLPSPRSALRLLDLFGRSIQRPLPVRIGNSPNAHYIPDAILVLQHDKDPRQYSSDEPLGAKPDVGKGDFPGVEVWRRRRLA